MMILEKILNLKKIKRKPPKFYFNDKDNKLFKLDYKIPEVYKIISKKNIIFNNNFTLSIKKLRLVYNGEPLFKNIKLNLFIFFKIFKRLLFFRIIKKKNLVILSDKYSSGYFHFISELLPKIEFYTKNALDLQTLILEKDIPSKWIAFFISKYKLKFFQHKTYHLVYCDKLNIYSSLAGTGNFRPEYLRLLNKRFTFGIKNKKTNPIIFIDRRKQDREIINQNYLNSYLKKKKILKVYMEDLSLQKQIKLANQARIIIGIHGGGLTNILWMNLKKKNALIELRDQYDDHNNCYFTLANALNINYFYLRLENLNNIKQYSKRLIGNFKININDLDYLIELATKEID